MQASRLVYALILSVGVATGLEGQESTTVHLPDVCEFEQDYLHSHPTKGVKVYWRDGLRFDSADHAIRLKIGGRLMSDVASFTGESGFEFRRARLYVTGVFAKRFEVKTQVDFAGGRTIYKDVYFGIRNIPVVGNVRVGRVKEPFGLEQMTSSNHITFLERSLNAAFYPGRNTGLLIFGQKAGGRIHWSGGVFRNSNAFKVRQHSGYNVSGRVTGLPFFESDGKNLFHVGLAYSYRSLDDAVRFSARPEAHLAPSFVATQGVTAKQIHLVGVEAAWLRGAFSLQGELEQAHVLGSPGEAERFSGSYVQVSYFLTGEHRRYVHSKGAFGSVAPKGRLGAFEVAARFSHLKLRARAANLTLGLNWYLTRNSRFMFNTIHSNLRTAGRSHIYQVRFQINF